MVHIFRKEPARISVDHEEETCLGLRKCAEKLPKSAVECAYNWLRPITAVLWRRIFWSGHRQAPIRVR